MSQRRSDRGTLETIRHQLIVLGENISDTYSSAQRAIDEMLNRLENHVKDCEHELETALTLLSDCHGQEDADCSYEAQAADRARNRLDEAEQSLSLFKERVRSYEALEGYGKNARERDLDDLDTGLRRFLDVLEVLAAHHLQEKNAVLSSTTATDINAEVLKNPSPNTKTILSAAFSTISIVASILNVGYSTIDNAFNPPTDAELLETVYQTDINSKMKRAQEINQMSPVLETAQDNDQWVKSFAVVHVDQLPEPEGIINQADFEKVPVGQMRDGLIKLQEIMRLFRDNPTSLNSDYWFEFDSSKGLNYEQGYQRVYDAFFGSTPIYLNYQNGKTTIVNGRHRIWLAKRMNIATLPVLLAVKQGT